MSYEIQDVLEFLRECVTEEKVYNDLGGINYVPDLTYEGKEVIKTLRQMAAIYDGRGYGKGHE